MALGQLQAQDVAVLGERRDRLAGHDDAPFRDGNRKNAAGAGREHRALAHLLGDDAAVAAHRVERAAGDVESGARRVDLDLGGGAFAQQLVGAVEVALGLVELRLLRLDAGVERLHLQHELGVGDGRELRAGLGAARLPSP